MHFHGMLLPTSLCFKVNISLSYVWHHPFLYSSLHHPSLPPPPSLALISLLLCVDYLWCFFSLPPSFNKKTLIFTPHALLPHALLSLLSCASITHVHTPFFIVTHLCYSPWIEAPRLHNSHSFESAALPVLPVFHCGLGSAPWSGGSQCCRIHSR